MRIFVAAVSSDGKGFLLEGKFDDPSKEPDVVEELIEQIHEKIPGGYEYMVIPQSAMEEVLDQMFDTSMKDLLQEKGSTP